MHLYEFRASTRKLKCTCGWERVLANSQPMLVGKAFAAHCKSEAAKS